MRNMIATDPNPTPLVDRLPADVYYYITYTLRQIIPTPPDSSPEHLARRDNAIMARFAALAPANAIEADIAADFVAATEHARDCMRTAIAPETSPQWVMKCRAQASAMTRQAYGALGRLERMQEQRRKLEKDEEARDRAIATGQSVIDLMAQAIAEQPLELDADLLNQLEPIDDLDPDTLTPEQQKATIHRQRSALIRRLRQTFNDPSFQETVAQVVADTGNSLTAELNRKSCPSTKAN